MAEQGQVRVGDQPRATSRDVSMAERPASIQYRVSNVRNLMGRPMTRPDRPMRRA